MYFMRRQTAQNNPAAMVFTCDITELLKTVCTDTSVMLPDKG